MKFRWSQAGVLNRRNITLESRTKVQAWRVALQRTLYRQSARIIPALAS